nr:ISH3 family transposase [uncultured Methanospirillum sp.]
MAYQFKSNPATNCPSISEKTCFRRVVSALDKTLQIPIRGKLNQRKVIETVVGMASNQGSIHSTTNSLVNVPCETSMRHHLQKLDFDFLQENNVEILTSDAISILNPGTAYKFAIDFTLDPYYGNQTQENCDYIVRSQKKKSTNDFYGYATLYVINKNRQLTLSILPMHPEFSSAYYVAYFLDVIKSLNLKMEVLCLDRGFYSKKVIKLLQICDVPHIIPVKRHGKRMIELLDGRGSRFDTYTMKDRKCPVTFRLVVVTTYSKGKRGKNKAINYGYVVFGIDWKFKKIFNIYRTRFAIESSYRMRNRSKPKTSSKSVKLRCFYAIVSMLLKNIWLAIAWDYFSPIQTGPRVIILRAFRFEWFLDLLWNYTKKLRKFRTRIPSYRVPIERSRYSYVK